MAVADPGFAAAVATADTDGNGVPDRDFAPDRGVAALYDGLFDAAPEMAGAVLERTDKRSTSRH